MKKNAKHNITVFGTGYVGLVTGICFAEIGNKVICVDNDEKKIAMLNKGCSPIYERGLDELLLKNMENGNISFTTDAKAGVSHGDYLFIAVGTPSAENGSANLEYVFAVAETIGEYMVKDAVVVDKSTVPVGTGDKVREIVKKALQKRKVSFDFDVVSNPEFLKQGDAIADFMHSDRVIIGAEDKDTFKKMCALYEPLKTLIVTMDLRSAELSKYAANAFLATRISFMNEIAFLCETLGADVENVRKGIATDPRVGPYFLHAGCGYGGSCFPKDVKALIKMAKDCGCTPDLFQSVEAINERQKNILFTKMKEYFKGDFKGKRIALWGLAFKPHTDDMREAPSRKLLQTLWEHGVSVQAYDPVAMQEAERIFGKRKDLVYCDSMTQTLEGADALVIVTEWDEFKKPNFDLLKKKLKYPVIFDGRNIFDPEKIVKLGFKYYCVGRKIPE